MGAKTKIEWSDATWNPIRGCSRVSPGCGGPGKAGGCYAEKIAARFSGPGMAFDGFARRVNGEARWTGKMAIVESALTLPLRWKKPRRIFVNSMSDLFHENLPDEAIDKVFAVMALCPQHTFQVLTKRAARMRGYFTAVDLFVRLGAAIHAVANWNDPGQKVRAFMVIESLKTGVADLWPLPNVWLGVSVEDQARADERIPLLLETPAAKRFLSCEPLLGSVWIREHLVGREIAGLVGNAVGWIPPIDLVIIGGESGPNARPFNVSWARSLIEQCRGSDAVPFVKQLGRRPYWDLLNGCGKWAKLTRIDLDGKQVDAITLKDKKGGDWGEWAEDLRVREMPA